MASLNPFNGTLGNINAAHLLRRATFGPTRSEILQYSTYNANQALDELFKENPVPDPPIDPLTGMNWLPKPDLVANSNGEDLFAFFKGWFMEQMRKGVPNIRERIVYFYHTHLPADHSLIGSATSLYYQNALYRYYAYGNFKTLFKKVCVDNAMLVYIDNALNDKDIPNENFAREMLELYSIGKGPQIGPEDYTNYTEVDVKAAARVLTGIKNDFDFETIDPDTKLARGKVTVNAELQAERHDPDPKIFSEKFQNTEIKPNPSFMIDGLATEEGFYDEIDQMIEMIFKQQETAKFICRKIYQFFVYYKITDEIEQDIIIPLANTFRTNNYDIVPVIRQLLLSEHFFDIGNTTSTVNNIGALIKSPLEITVGSLRYFKINMPNDLTDLYLHTYGQSLLRLLKKQGLTFYEPIDVAGYPPYHQEPVFNRNWISPNWLANRYAFVETLLGGIYDGGPNIICQLDVLGFVKDTNNVTNPADAELLITELTDSVFPVKLPAERLNYFLNTLFLNGTAVSEWTNIWNTDQNQAKTYLERLIKGIFQSPEYQLF